MEIYISGLYCGSSPASGVGVIRSLRRAYPDAKLIGVDYSDRSSGIHCPELDDVWLQRPWKDLNLDRYAEKIEEKLAGGAYWLSCLDVEIHWAANSLSANDRFLAPSFSALSQTSKPKISCHQELGLALPPYIELTHSDGELHRFCREYGWQLWLKSAYFDAKWVNSWANLNVLRKNWMKAMPQAKLFLQAHVRGYEESICFVAVRGELISAVKMSKRDVTEKGKTWAGEISTPNAREIDALKKVVASLDWTGAGEIEMIRDLEDRGWIMEINPRFPAWIYGSTLAGQNLPARLIEKVSGHEPEVEKFESNQFTRLVLEVPVKKGHALVPMLQPGLYAPALDKHHQAGALNLPFDSSTETSELKTTSQDKVSDTLTKALSQIDLTKVETPNWIYFPEVAEANFSNLALIAKELCRDGVQVKPAYSFKTNPDLSFVNLALKYDMLAETISKKEVQHAIQQGFRSDQVVLNGPGKVWPRNIDDQKVNCLFADSIEELESIVFKSQGGVKYAEVIGIRIKPPGLHSRFGISLERFNDFERVAELLSQLPEGQKIGCHFHIASSTLGVRLWWSTFNTLLRICRSIELVSSRAISVLDLGGGWFPDDFGSVFLNQMQEATSKAKQALPKLDTVIFEPGKALTQESMALAVEVLEVRNGRDGALDLVIDGSIAELPLIGSYPHRIFFQETANKTWRLLSRGDGRILGRICMEDDLIAIGIEIPKEIKSGDKLLICDVGAYERSMSYVFGQGVKLEKAASF